MAKVYQNKSKFVCLKHIEGFKPGAVVARDQLPATADMEFLLGNSALREATGEEATKEVVDINPKTMNDAANAKIKELEKQVEYHKGRTTAVEKELQSIKIAGNPAVDLEKTLATRDGEIATLKTKLAQITDELQKAKDAAASTPTAPDKK